MSFVRKAIKAFFRVDQITPPTTGATIPVDGPLSWPTAAHAVTTRQNLEIADGVGASYVVNGASVGITGLEGGAGKLDGIVTVALTTSLYFVNDATHGFGLWELVAGTDAHNPGGGVVRPDDYNGVTNAKVWKQRL